MFHVGHAQFLKEARELGTFLFVGVHDDQTVTRSKGANYPVMSLNERVLNVCACKWVDEVVIGAPRVVSEDLIKTWKIDVVARGAGHKRDSGRDVNAGEDPFALPRKSGILKEVQSQWEDLCHETVVSRIIAEREAYLNRNKDRARREDVYYEGKKKDDTLLEA